MNEQIENYFREYERQTAESLKTEKEKLLIRLGLYTEEYEYHDQRKGFAKYDPTTKKYISTKKVPIEISDEEYSRILQIEKERAEANKAKKAKKEIKLENVNCGAERTLNFLITLQLILTILISVAFIIAGFITAEEYTNISSALRISGTAIGIIIFVIGWINWAHKKVIINISNNLHNISRLAQDKEQNSI